MHSWYVLRCPDNNALSMAQQFTDRGLQAFTPLEYCATNIGEEKLWQQVPSRPDLLFVCATYDDIHNIIIEKKLGKLQFAYDNSAKNTSTPLTIPHAAMNNLIRIVECSIPQSYSVTDDEIHYRPGGMVQVTDGPFKGIIGRVARIHTQTRVVVSIPGIISYATTYVPKHQLTPVANND